MTGVRWALENPYWTLAVLFFLVGDLVTTALGIGLSGFVEAGPLTGPLVDEYGLGVMVVVKLVVFGSCTIPWLVVSDPHRVGIPIGLIVVGASATSWNTYLLLAVVVF